MKTKKQNRFLKFLKEIAIVVIGVLIAVSINKIKENIDNRNYINKTLNTIEKEINQSEVELEKVLSKHLLTVDSISANINNKKESLTDIVFRLGGIQGAEIKNIGLRFFISNKADLMEYEVISKLSDIEIASKLINDKMDRLVDFTFANMDKKDRISKEKFLLHLKNLINTENGLLKLYSEFPSKKIRS